MTTRGRTPVLAGTLAVLVLAGCTTPERTDAPSASPSATTSTTPSSAAPAPGTLPPSWLGTRAVPRDPDAVAALGTPPELRRRAFTLPDTLPPLPGTGFHAEVDAPAPAAVVARSTWDRECPAAASDLAWVRLTFRGFDGQRHTGELLLHRSVADDVVGVFHELWRQDFPMERLAITSDAERDAVPTGDGNGTGAFSCRAITGGSSFSEHAYGLAIDLNPFQNPYRKGDVVIPELARSYLDRGDVRPGMVLAGSPVVAAFARIGWEWGGDWRTLKDYQHFSLRDR